MHPLKSVLGLKPGAKAMVYREGSPAGLGRPAVCPAPPVGRTAPFILDDRQEWRGGWQVPATEALT